MFFDTENCSGVSKCLQIDNYLWIKVKMFLIQGLQYIW